MDKQKIKPLHKGVRNLDDFREKLINNEIIDALIVYTDVYNEAHYTPLTDSELADVFILLDLAKDTIKSHYAETFDDEES